MSTDLPRGTPRSRLPWRNSRARAGLRWLSPRESTEFRLLRHVSCCARSMPQQRRTPTPAIRGWGSRQGSGGIRVVPGRYSADGQRVTPWIGGCLYRSCPGSVRQAVSGPAAVSPRSTHGGRIFTRTQRMMTGRRRRKRVMANPSTPKSSTL
jgi:hypothetical protein